LALLIKPIQKNNRNLKEVPATISDAISKDLKTRIQIWDLPLCIMQATGMVNDHVENCWKRNS
jgi:DNA-3-methyladenine glycosylase I